MSSGLQTILELVQLNDYASVVIITAVVYDYLLTFASEIEYVWCRPWSCVSALFVLVRYLGLCWVIVSSLLGSTFVSGPVKTCADKLYLQIISITVPCAALYVLGTCVFPIFIAAANLVMILRVYAIWNQSRRILTLLLCIYVPGVISSIVFMGIYSNTNTRISVTVLQLADKSSVCNVAFQDAPMLLLMYMGIPRFVLGATLLVLTVVRAVVQLVEMHKATRQWRLNQCVKQLVRDGFLYFLMNALYNIATGFNNEPSINSTAMLMLDMTCVIAMAVMMPRFIINVRELYDPDPLRGWQAVESGFRVLPRPISRQSVTVSMNAIMDITPTWQGPIGEGTAIDLADMTAIEMLRDYMRRL